jgi:hypothetical protein
LRISPSTSALRSNRGRSEGRSLRRC